MRATIQKWRNGASAGVAAAVPAAARLGFDQPVDARTENGQIAINPIRATSAIDALIDAITDDNKHAETDMGAPTGREIW